MCVCEYGMALLKGSMLVLAMTRALNMKVMKIMLGFSGPDWNSWTVPFCMPVLDLFILRDHVELILKTIPRKNKIIIWEWLIEPIEMVFLLFFPIVSRCSNYNGHVTFDFKGRLGLCQWGSQSVTARQLDRRCGRALCCSPALDIGRRGSCSLHQLAESDDGCSVLMGFHLSENRMTWLL